MKIAFTAKGKKWDSEMDPRFGRTEYLLVFSEENNKLTSFDNRNTAREAHGAGPKTAQALSEFQPDVLITGNGPGDNAARVIDRMSITVYTGAINMTVREAYDAYLNKSLQKA